MSSIRTGIQAKSLNISGPTTIDLSQISTTFSNSFNQVSIHRESGDKAVGYFPENLDHNVLQEIGDYHRRSFAHLKSFLHSNPKQSILVIHGPLSSGKSTLAHMLMGAPLPNFVNRIWINAESNDSLNRDLRQLYKIMRTLQNLPFDDNQDLQLLLKWLYHNLLSNSTLLIFDNAAFVDVDRKSALEHVYNLAKYLPSSACFTSKDMVAPSIVITSRVVLNHQLSSSQSQFTFLRICGSFLTLHGTSTSEANGAKLLADLELIGGLEISRLSRLLLTVITIMAPQTVLVDLLYYLVCECPLIQGFLEVKSEVRADDIETALDLLQDFSIIAKKDGELVRMPHAVADGATRLLESSVLFSKEDLIKSIITSVSDSISEETAPLNKTFINFSYNLLTIKKRAHNLNDLIRSLYPYMLELDVPVSEAFMTFSFRGNNYEAQLDEMTHVCCKHLIDGSDTGLSEFATFVKVRLDEKLHVLRCFLSSSSIEATSKSEKSCPYTPIIQVFFRGDYKAACEGYQKAIFSPCFVDSQSIFHSLYWAESQHKTGLFSQTSLSAIYVVPRFCMAYFYSALPPECLQSSFLTSQGEYRQAQQILTKALRQTQSEALKNSVITAAFKHSFAKIEAQTGRLGKAIVLVDHAVAIRHQFLGPTTLRYVQAVATKAKILKLLGQHREAYKCLVEAKEKFSAKSHYLNLEGKVDDHQNCLILRYYLVKLGSFDQRSDDALSELEAVLKQMAINMSPTNHYRIKCRLLQAQILKNSGEFRKSKILLRALVEDATAIYGGFSNPRVMKLSLAYANVLIHTGNMSKAEKLAKAVLDTTDFEKLRLEAKLILAAIKKHEGHDAAPDLRSVVEESTVTLGPYHLRTFSYKADLAETLLNSNKTDNFEEASELVASISTCMKDGVFNFERTSLVRLTWTFLKALVLLKLKKFTECLEALDFIELLLPESHKMWAKVRYLEATALAHLGGRDNFPRAHQITLNLLHWRTTFRSAKSPEPDVAELNAFLAFLTLKLKCHEVSDSSAEVYTLCQNSIALVGQIHDEDHPRVIQAKMNLAIVYGIFGDEKRALEVFETVRLASAAQSGQDQVIQAKESLKLDFCKQLKKFKTRIKFDRGAFILDSSDDQ